MTQKKAHLDDLIHDNQVYRFAARVCGYDDPTTMTAKQLNIFCFVWFGALAFVVSTLGPLLALCYYHIKFQTAVGRTAWSRLLGADGPAFAQSLICFSRVIAPSMCSCTS